MVTVSPTYNFDSLAADVNTILFSAAGETCPLVIQGTTAGVSQLVSNQFLTFVSADTSVATVDAYGTVSPVSSGKTIVTFSYGKVSGTVTVLVGSAITVANQTAAPTFSPSSGTFSAPQSVTLQDSTAGAVIYYTIDGTAPTTASAIYTSPVAVSVNETIAAIAVAPSFTNSPVASAAYVISLPTVATPSFSPSAGSFSSAQTVTISDSTAGATVYYTTNGTAPTTSSAKYLAPISVGTTETIETVAVASGYNNSPVASATYTISLPQDFAFNLSASSLSVIAGQSGTLTASIVPQNSFNGAVSFSCSGLPAGAICSFSPSTVTPKGTASSTTAVTVTTAARTGRMTANKTYEVAGIFGGLLFLALGRLRKRSGLGIFLLAVVGSVSLLSGCATTNPTSTPQPTTSSVTITAVSGSLTHSSTFVLTVQ